MLAVLAVLGSRPAGAAGAVGWIFAGGLTDVQVTITVTDTRTGLAKTYTNPQGNAFQPIQDTSALPVCP